MESLISWVRFVDNMGYISFDNFLQLPSTLTNSIMAIRASDSLKSMRSDLRITKNEEVKKKLRNNLNELEAFFR